MEDRLTLAKEVDKPAKMLRAHQAAVVEFSGDEAIPVVENSECNPFTKVQHDQLYKLLGHKSDFPPLLVLLHNLVTIHCLEWFNFSLI